MSVPDRTRPVCYSVGPLVLTGAGLASAAVLYDPQVSQWVVILHWTNRDFADSIATTRNINRSFAVTLNGIAQTEFTLEPAGVGISHALIISNYSRPAAIAVAGSIIGVDPSKVSIERWNSSDG